MKEAFRLLNKSIIRVETPDINLEQEDQMEEEEQHEEGTNLIFYKNKAFYSFLLPLPVSLK